MAACNVRFFAQNPATTTDWRNVGRMTIDILPADDVLLDKFDFLMVETNGFEAENWWRTLVHVCRKWRNVIFWVTTSPGSATRLFRQDPCERDAALDVWLPLPIVIHHFAPSKSGGDNIIAALERNDRVCQIRMKLGLGCNARAIPGAI
jgi:hypothetical protein